jgi:hypothetical protein
MLYAIAAPLLGVIRAGGTAFIGVVTMGIPRDSSPNDHGVRYLLPALGDHAARRDTAPIMGIFYVRGLGGFWPGCGGGEESVGLELGVECGDGGGVVEGLHHGSGGVEFLGESGV